MGDSSARYTGERYLSWNEIVATCERLSAELPEWFALTEIGRSREGRPILLVSVGAEGRDTRPAVWIDGGTHASEFTGVMAAVYALEAWADALAAGDPETVARFRRNTAYVAPCVSPDGFVHMADGGPFVRSSLRPPRDGEPRTGFEPWDIDRDGTVRWMRWRHPAGAWVPDADVPCLMRPRTLDDDPDDAWFFAPEGRFLNWDGFRWSSAPRKYGIDLNRNFPGSWRPFSMFGMDSGAYALSEPESRAIVDAVAARRNIAAALSNHTYTGCILTQPYRADTPLDGDEIRLMQALAEDLVAGSDYRVFKVHPDFAYDPKQSIGGVWSDTLATVFGIPGYTLEFWDPFRFADVLIEKPASFFMEPDTATIRTVLGAFSERFPELVRPWKAIEHPQLGEVEIGGIDYMRTIRNPPESLLRPELDVGLRAADRLMSALPRVTARCRLRWHAEGLARISLKLENFGFLSTSGLRPSVECPGVAATIRLGDGATLVRGAPSQALPHLEGWGAVRAGAGRHPVYPDLSSHGNRARAEWWVQGSGRVEVEWVAGRAERGRLVFDL